jgi:NAD(P)-dependent dehydrogenase (short-subunit alcohol dehydrogenase family)
MDRLTNRTIVITGGGSGIGAATARRTAAEGASVIIVDRDGETGARIVDELSALSAYCRFMQADLSDRDEIAAVSERISHEVDTLHGLVNNAGIVRPSTIESLTYDEWDAQLAINLTAPALLIRGLLGPLERGRASIVNISSEGAFRPRGQHAAYDASKAGIAALTRTFAAELADRHIRSNSIAPGWVVTEMHFGRGPSAMRCRDELLAQPNPNAVMNRLARPEEIAAAVAFLLSDDASFMTGTCLHVDGGMGLG